MDRGDWAGALQAYDASAALVGKSHWCGELLDGAALAAQQLKRSDVAERLAAAWHALRHCRDYCDGWSPRIAAQPLFGRRRGRLSRAAPRRPDGSLACFVFSPAILAPQPTCYRKPQVLAGRSMSIRGTSCFRRSLSCWHTEHRGACRTCFLQTSIRHVAIRWTLSPLMTSSGGPSWVRPRSPG